MFLGGEIVTIKKEDTTKSYLEKTVSYPTEKKKEKHVHFEVCRKDF